MYWPNIQNIFLVNMVWREWRTDLPARYSGRNKGKTRIWWYFDGFYNINTGKCPNAHMRQRRSLFFYLLRYLPIYLFINCSLFMSFLINLILFEIIWLHRKYLKEYGNLLRKKKKNMNFASIFVNYSFCIKWKELIKLRDDSACIDQTYKIYFLLTWFDANKGQTYQQGTFDETKVRLEFGGILMGLTTSIPGSAQTHMCVSVTKLQPHNNCNFSAFNP